MVRLVLLLLGLFGVSVSAQDSQGIEFFERRIRPVLVERCFECHSTQSRKLKGGLYLDSREGMLKGGDTRPAVVPGYPEKSLLAEAVLYENPDLQMPPKGKLSEQQISDFQTWIKMGAPWRATGNASALLPKKSEFDLDARRREHWAWQPLRPQQPPTVHQTEWPRTAVDRFILAQLQAQGLQPAPDADARTLIRRVHFDLTGLPPSVQDVEEFVSSPSDAAYERAVDRLLASPRFGERWARHWLDLVRYSETLGHEFDYPIPNAWQYRDYVIRALNANLPYDQFIYEHIAGDLLRPARLNPTHGFNESIIATGFYWFGQQTHSPVDVRQHQAEVVENQIDVLSKTFSGLTVACARCHDHKFDAISTRDYYALYGIVTSSRYAQRSIDDSLGTAAIATKLQTLKAKIRQLAAEQFFVQAEQIDRYVLAAASLAEDNPQTAATAPPDPAKEGLDAARLERWRTALRSAGVLSGPDSANDPQRDQSQTPTELMVLADFRHSDFSNWFVDDDAFGNRPSRGGDFIVGDSNKPIASILPHGAAHSGMVSRRLEGALRSQTLTVDKRYLHLRVAGAETRFNVCIDNYLLIQNPIYGSLRQVVSNPDWKWVTVDLGMWKGHRAYIEFSDLVTPDLAGGGKPKGYSPEGWIAVDQIVASENKEPPLDADLTSLPSIHRATFDSREHRAVAYKQLAMDSVTSWADLEQEKAPVQLGQSRPSQNDCWAFLSWLVAHGLLEPVTPTVSATFADLLSQYRAAESLIKPRMRVPAAIDGTGLDEAVFIRGNPKTLGPPVPRRYLEAIAGANAPTFNEGSGRLQLARSITDPDNPFTTRVFVNRVWHHLFGRGIVPTPDDFGVLGQAPTHPQLLDWLAIHFRDQLQWSPKHLIRLLVTSRTYRMSSHPFDINAEEKDPNNSLWHRMPVNRLDGESIRDAILALSGTIDSTMFGPSVPVHLDEFMDGRGRPAKSGPLDGAGRRSVYLEVRRNFLSPIMRAFDTPVPFTTAGRRTVSNVPAQSLILLNHPFVLEQTKLWADRLLNHPVNTPAERVRHLYLAVFSRPPSDTESLEALNFLEQQSKAYGSDQTALLSRPELWADLCHVLLNVKEFVFVR